MNIKLIWVGKTDERYLNDGIGIYIDRLQHYVSLRVIEIPALRGVKSLSKEEIKEREGREILKQTDTSDHIILLDEHGETFTSKLFAKQLQMEMNKGVKNLVFIIGGAFGFSPKVYEKACGRLSLSAMTFSHRMIRLFFLEQLYRAYTILKNEPYHNE